MALAPAERYPDETTGETVSSPEAAVAVSYVIGRDMDVATGDRADQGEYPKVDPEDVFESARAGSAITWSGLPGLVPLRRIFAHRLDSAHFAARSEAPALKPGLVAERGERALRAGQADP